MNSGTVFLVLLGVLIAAALIFSGLKVLAPEDLIPQEIDGFVLKEKLERVEPLFEGERYSAHAFFEPSEGFEGVETLGVSIYLFANRKRALGAWEEMVTIMGEGVEVTVIKELKANLVEGEGQVSLIWSHRRLLYVIVVTGKEPERMKEAAILAAQSIKSTTPR
jgi:hypothetical protein